MNYNDRLIKIVVLPAIVLFMVHIGRDGSLLQLLQNKDNYYLDLLFSAVVTWSVWYITRFVIIQFDKRLSWKDNFYKRFTFQLLTTLPAAAMLMMTEALIYAAIIQVNFIYIMAPDFELAVGLLLTVGFNIIYLALYLHARPPVLPESKDIKLVGISGTRQIPILGSDIAYFYSRNKVVFAVTTDNSLLRTDYILDRLEPQLKANFFRINRKVLASRKAIESYQPVENRKIEVSLLPIFDEPVYVSQKKASIFKSWIVPSS